MKFLQCYNNAFHCFGKGVEDYYYLLLVLQKRVEDPTKNQCPVVLHAVQTHIKRVPALKTLQAKYDKIAKWQEEGIQ